MIATAARIALSAIVLAVYGVFLAVAIGSGHGNTIALAFAAFIAYKALRSLVRLVLRKREQRRIIAENAAKGITTRFVSMRKVRRSMRRQARLDARSAR